MLRREVDVLHWKFFSLCYQKADNVSVCLAVSEATELRVRASRRQITLKETTRWLQQPLWVKERKHLMMRAGTLRWANLAVLSSNVWAGLWEQLIIKVLSLRSGRLNSKPKYSKQINSKLNILNKVFLNPKILTPLTFYSCQSYLNFN